MAELTMDAGLAQGTSRRAAELFEQHRREIFERTDRLFAALLFCEWLFGIFLAFVVSPRAWAGSMSSVHPHIWAALALGGSIVSLPIALALRHPGRTITRHVIATAQMLFSALLIHLTGGRIETHFHVFGSLAFLAFYRDWRVFVPATVVVALDHFLRGLVWPQSVYGVLVPGGWRWVEHAGWVAFEDLFLIKSCLQGVVEMRSIAVRRAQLEATNEIVERAVAERTRALAESEERFQAFMDNGPAVRWMKDEQGRYVYVNQVFERVFGIPRGQAVGTIDRDRWAPEIADPLEANDRRALADGKGMEVLETIPTADGIPRRWTVFRFSLADAAGRPLLAAIALDMTEKLQLAEQLRQSQRMEAVGQLAGGIAQDFNNLLTAVTGYARLLQRELREGEGPRRYVDEIVRAGEKAAGLTQQLLAYSRKQMLQPQVIKLNSIVTETEPLVRRLIGEDIRLTVVLDPDLESALVDPSQIGHVIVNLALNARDAMATGGQMTIETANVELAAHALGQEGPTRRGHYVLLAVSDTGHGMSAEIRARAFEPFFTTKPVGKGTGLGLSTVHGIVHQSGGHVEIYTEVGVGTTFKVYLPARTAHGADEEQLPVADEAPRRGSERVLLVEDDEGVLNLARDLFRSQGYHVIEARHGEDAIEIFKRQLDRIDILVTDVVMPGMSGRQLADRLRRICPELKVLFMSGYADEAIVQHGVLEPGIDFVQKPFTPDRLLGQLRRVLDRREAA
jgi:PAS domain S-box-containing protein